jgi:hypothetical protein
MAGLRFVVGMVCTLAGPALLGVSALGCLGVEPQVGQGPTGAAGATGATGPAGPAGPMGPIGPQGPEGPQGAQGPAGNTPDAGAGAWVTIFDQHYNGNGVITVPITAAGGFTARVLFNGSVVPFSGYSEWIVKTSAGGTSGYVSFLSAEGVADAGPVGATQPGFLMARTLDTNPTAVSFDYLLTELGPDAGVGGLLGFGQGMLRGVLGPELLRGGGSNDYAGASTSIILSFWNTSSVTGHFVVLQLM